MKKMTKYSLAAVAALTALTLAPLVQAQGFGRGPGGRGWGHGHGRGFGPRMAAELNLTDAQKTQIQQLQAQMQADLAEVHTALDGKRQELHALWMADSPDADAILSKQAEMDPLRAQIRARRVELKLAVFNLLTPEQKARFKELKAERMKNKRGMGKRGMGKRGMGPGAGGYGGFGGGLGPDADF